MMLLNILLGTLVVEVGFWLLWGSDFPVILVGWALTVGIFLWWRARTITQVWAWSTLILGLESLAWPLLLMIQVRGYSSATPSDEEMGTILSAVVLGLFSSVFWISFSYGLFKRNSDIASGTARAVDSDQPAKPKPAKRRTPR
jgi:hypothetical protein